MGSAVAEDAAPDAPADAAAPRRWGVFLAVSATVVVLDQATKAWAVDALDDAVRELPFGVDLRLTYNPGAAFSLGGGGGFGLIVAGLAVVLIGLLLGGSTARSRAGAVAVGLVAGGALGNLLDRGLRGDSGLMSGEVVDFVDLGWWPVFNVADVAVVCGAIALVVLSWRRADEPVAGA